MRKHFLLLFLMALLPLAGWAVTDISGATFTINVVSFQYTAATPTIGAATAAPTPAMIPTVTPAGATDPLVYNTDYTLKFYDKQGNPIDKSAVKEVDNYYVAAEGKGDYSGITEKVAFQIVPAKLTVTITADITKEYGNHTKPAATFTRKTSTTDANGNVLITGWKGTSDGTVAKEEAIVAALDFAWTDKEKEAKANYSGTEFYSTTTKGQQLTWSSNESVDENYTLTFVHEDGMKVTPVALTTGTGSKFTYTVTGYTKVAANGKSGGFEYNGTNQVPTYEITYTDPQGTVRTLKQKSGNSANDFDITYTFTAGATTPSAVSSVAATNNKGAGFYWPTVKPTAKGNYTTDQAQPFKFDGNTTYYQIRQKALSFAVVDVTKVYDGQAFTESTGTPATVNDAVIEPYGLVAADITTDNLSAISNAYKAKRKSTASDFTKNVGTWEVEPTGTFGTDGFWANYYEDATNNQNGFMTIAPRPVIVTPKAVVDNIADPLTDFENLVLNTTTGDASFFGKYVAIEVKGTNKGLAVESTDATNYPLEVADVLSGFTLGLTEEHTNSGSWKKIIAVTPKATTGTGAYAGNYKITAGENANYTIEGRTWSISPKNVTLTYGQNVTENLKYNTNGLGTATFDDSGIKYIVKKVNATTGAETVVNIPENGRLDVLTSGSYVVYIDPASVVVAPTDYQAPTISTNPAALTINKKQVWAIPAPVTLSVGNTIDDLNTLGKSAVRFLDSNAQDATTNAYTGSDAIEEGDVISYMLVFSANGVTTDANGKITEFATDASKNTIVVKEITTAPAAGSVELPYYVNKNSNANYTINVTTTALVTNGQGVLVLDRTDAELLTKLAASDGKTYTVKFANNRTLSAQKWAMMVLPFDTDVATVSAAMKARKSTWTAASPAYETGYAIVNTLKSNTTSSNIQFELAFGELPANKPFLVKTSKQVNLNDVVFEGVEIADPADEEVEGDTYGGVTFMGLYTDKADLSNTERTIKGNIWYTNRTNIGLKAFEAYLAGCDVAARVFIEDIDDNGATAIKELNAETGKANNVDGWYTVNGIKLESMPTEKGVYINNGKKVVIK